ncbi:MAG: chloride channel protein [Bdellovibrionota bacterium]
MKRSFSRTDFDLEIMRSETSSRLDISKSKTLIYTAVWISAGIIGGLAVAYARLIALCQRVFFQHFTASPAVVSLTGPFLFLAATWLVRQFAPDAKGSGIPQVLAAIEQSKSEEQATSTWKSSLISLRTAVVKVISSCVGILGGASIGREGPTIQIAASGFAWVAHKFRRYAPEIDFQTILIAGSAAGVSAAFNTPIAGIAFAFEELASSSFGSFKQITSVAIVVSGLVAQGVAGDYLYFGHPEIIPVGIGLLIVESIAIGLVGGILGGLFALVLAKPQVARVPKHWMVRAALAGIVCSTIGYFTSGDTSGSGYEVTERLLDHGTIQGISLAFPILKLVTTTLSYLSGMAGGIFSPSLSIGAGAGLALAKLFGWVNFKACALTGMVAFFSGAIGAPLTGVIIVMEMTNEHLLVLPFMIAAYLAYSVGRRIMPVPLYHYLAEKHLEG